MNNTNQPEVIILTRDCEGLLIPYGEQILLPENTEVMITQALGGSFTVNVNGNLVRIASKDADALGKEVINPEVLFDPNASIEDKVIAQLKTIFDPEIPVNIYDLGLIYENNVTKLENNKYHIKIKMTLTAPGCGMGPVLSMEAQEKIRAINDVEDAQVEMVLDPPWDQSMMSEAAKLQLGMMY